MVNPFPKSQICPQKFLFNLKIIKYVIHEPQVNRTSQAYVFVTG